MNNFYGTHKFLFFPAFLRWRQKRLFPAFLKWRKKIFFPPKVFLSHQICVCQFQVFLRICQICISISRNKMPCCVSLQQIAVVERRNCWIKNARSGQEKDGWGMKWVRYSNRQSRSVNGFRLCNLGKFTFI